MHASQRLAINRLSCRRGNTGLLLCLTLLHIYLCISIAIIYFQSKLIIWYSYRRGKYLIVFFPIIYINELGFVWLKTSNFICLYDPCNIGPKTMYSKFLTTTLILFAFYKKNNTIKNFRCYIQPQEGTLHPQTAKRMADFSNHCFISVCTKIRSDRCRLKFLSFLLQP